MKIAGVQMDVKLADISHNLQTIERYLQQAASAGARLVIFPECAITGYCFNSRETAVQSAEAAGGISQQKLTILCRELNLFCVVGFLEKDQDELYNAAALMGPDGLVGIYRKIHLPYVGVDRFTDYGQRPFTVDEIPDLRLGMNICYDSAFPEASRILALKGADLIALPTNWPPGAECMTPAVICTRAVENKIYYAAINRIGTEAGVTFIGRSCIAGPNGEILDSASPDEEKILFAEIDTTLTRNKHIIRQQDIHEIDRFADRRPEMYGNLLNAHQLVTPRQRLHPDH